MCFKIVTGLYTQLAFIRPLVHFILQGIDSCLKALRSFQPLSMIFSETRLFTFYEFLPLECQLLHQFILLYPQIVCCIFLTYYLIKLSEKLNKSVTNWLSNWSQLFSPSSPMKPPLSHVMCSAPIIFAKVIFISLFLVLFQALRFVVYLGLQFSPSTLLSVSG